MAIIQIVDDDPDYVEIMRTVLMSVGHEVQIAFSGPQGLAMMRQNKPDLVLLDVMMSYVLDGLNVSHEMREDPQLRDIPVIMISSIAGSAYAGMFPTDEYIPIDEWISKPVDPQALVARVAKYV